MDLLSDLPNSVRTVVDRVHARHNGKQHLGCTDIAGCFVPADMLFARLQCKAYRGPPFRVLGNADDSPRNLALEFVLSCKKRGVRPTVAKRHSEPLRAADHNI